MRRASSSVACRNESVVTRIRELKADHPFWGYRRVWATLRFTDKIVITPKRVLRLMRLHQLLVTAETKNKASRTPTKSKPQATASNQWWGIDMTKVMTASGWSYVVIVLDWFDKHIVGYYAGDRAKTEHWLSALDLAVNREFPEGIEGQSLHLMSDNGSQPTSVRFMQVCGQLSIDQAFTSYNNPKGNADTERMMRTLKEELFWLREWASPAEIAKALDAWVPGYHETYRHSTLGYKTPNEFKQEHGPKTQLQAA
jgi:transposase InsO family protein